MEGIKLIIFDLDGTLVDAYPAIIASFNYAMKKLDYPPQDVLAIRRAVGRGDEQLLRPFIEAKDLKRALSLYRRHHAKALLQGARPFSGVEKLLGCLKKKGYRLAVASNRPTKFSRILIRHLGLDKYFTYVLCADKLKHRKPHPEILKKIMRRFSCLPEQTLFVGDMSIDAQAGKRAKVKTVIVTTGSSSAQEIRRQKPCRIIKAVANLAKIL